MGTIKNIKENIKQSQLLEALVLKNIKGGRNCPPPVDEDRQG